MDRMYPIVFKEHFAANRQMIFVMGPRQSGKTTVAQSLVQTWSDAYYFNWDNINDRDKILAGSNAIAGSTSLNSLKSGSPLIVFDEIHKYANWRDFLKGLYDSYPSQADWLITGSAKLDVFSRGGDSLMGRYFPFRFHPLSIAEIVQSGANTKNEYWPMPKPISDDKMDALWRFGGYPDPFLKQSDAFSLRWKKLRNQQLFHEEVRDLTRIQDIHSLELLAKKLCSQAGALTSYASLSKQLRVSDKTIRNWLETLKSLYYCFAIHPWSKNINRSLLKEPKYYLWDWSLCTDDGARAENLVALHLLEAVHFWSDLGSGDYGLHFVRDKEKREVDFLISKNQKPWMLIDVKLCDNTNISPALHAYTKALNPEFSFQVVMNMEYVDKNCFDLPGIRIVPARTFLSQLI